MDALLREVDALRLTLGSDLSLAAAAVEADRVDVAGDVLDADRAELARFADWASQQLHEAGRDAPEGIPAAAAVAGADEVAAAVDLTPRRRLRQGLLRAGAPAIAASAAAVLALVTVVVDAPEHPPAPTTQPAMSPLAASYVQFSRLARSDADPDRLIAAAAELHRSLEALIRGAATDPAAARQVLRILQAEADILRADRPHGSATVLAQAKALVRRLQSVLPPETLRALRPKPHPTTKPVNLLPPPEASQQADADHSKSEPEQRPATSSPAPEPERSQAPSAEPEAPAPDPKQSPSPTPDVDDPWPFGKSGLENLG